MLNSFEFDAGGGKSITIPLPAGWTDDSDDDGRAASSADGIDGMSASYSEWPLPIEVAFLDHRAEDLRARANPAHGVSVTERAIVTIAQQPAARFMLEFAVGVHSLVYQMAVDDKRHLTLIFKSKSVDRMRALRRFASSAIEAPNRYARVSESPRLAATGQLFVKLPVPAHWSVLAGCSVLPLRAAPHDGASVLRVAFAGAFIAFDPELAGPGSGEQLQHDRACERGADHLPLAEHAARLEANVMDDHLSCSILERTLVETSLSDSPVSKLVYESCHAKNGQPQITLAYLYRDELDYVWRAIYTFRKARIAMWRRHVESFEVV